MLTQMRSRAASLAFVGLMTAIVLGSSRQAEAGDLIVNYDQSRLLRMPRQVADVIVGNPSIADVAVQGGRLLVVTGKTFGITNIIALDSDGKIIRDQRIIVERDENRIVNVHKAGVRQSYSCTPHCSPTLTIGDDSAFFEQIQKHSTAKAGFSSAGAAATGSVAPH